MLLQTVYGVESPEADVLFEYPIKKDANASTIFVDAYQALTEKNG